ncbi:hypothetical protein [Bacillus sp. RS11]
MISVPTGRFVLCESGVLTKRQQQLFSVRKRSVNEAAATTVFCAKVEC